MTVSRQPAVLLAALAGCGLAVSIVTVGPGSQARADEAATTGRVIDLHGLSLVVPAGWHDSDFRRTPHACLRFDRSTVYVGHVGDQSDCPAHLIGGAPALHLEALDSTAIREAAGPVRVVPPGHDLAAEDLPFSGPVAFAVEDVGVLVTAAYGPGEAQRIEAVLSTTRVAPRGSSQTIPSPPQQQALPGQGVSVPGTLLGKGFDTCAAPSQSLMDAWKADSDYASVGIYIGGSSMGCAQPNLTPDWVSSQVGNGWHLVPTYVGSQAPCTHFLHRMPYSTTAARTAGHNEASDAAARALALGIVAPSTIFVDIEGYDSSNPSCVKAVLAYVSGWSNRLHTYGYQAGVYSSASSGIHDISTYQGTPGFVSPDDIWIAWWNGRADVDGGQYVGDDQWTAHRRLHQYAGNVRETHGGYTVWIDRNYLDLSRVVPRPPGCPTRLDFTFYRDLHVGYHGAQVTATQCLLAWAGFDPGDATGIFDWRTGVALKAFKRSRGLRNDAVLRLWSWAALTSVGPTQFLQMGFLGDPGEPGPTGAHRPAAAAGGDQRVLQLRHRGCRQAVPGVREPEPDGHRRRHHLALPA